MSTIPTQDGAGRRGVIAKLVAPALVVVVVGVAGVVMAGGPGADSSGERSAELAVARIGEFSITTLANGELEAKNRVEIRSRVERTTSIVEVVDEGILVKKGDVLVRLNADEIETEIAEDELRVVEARSELEAAETAEKIQVSENESKLRQAQTKYTIASLTLEQWRQGDVAKTTKANDLAVEKAEKNLIRLREKYEQSQQLFEKEFLSKDELDRDEISFIEAEAELERSMLEREVYLKFQFEKEKAEHELDVKEAESELERVKEENDINLNNREATTTNRRRQLALHETRLAEEKAQLEACTIIAPSDGLVVYGTSTETGRWMAQSEGSLDIGRQVRRNDLLIVLPDTSEMIANVKVHESLAGRIRPGQPASVTIEALDAIVPGVVDSIGVLAESGGWRDPNRREYTVRITLEPGDVASRLKPTMRCESRIVLGDVTDALVVPLPAVFNEGAVRFVYVPSGARYVKRPVRIGRMSDTEVEIVAGLSEGEVVLLREPDPAEVLGGVWSPEELETAGYQTDEQGNLMPATRGGRQMAPGGQSTGQPGRPQGATRTGGRPGGG